MKRGKQIDTWYPFFIDKWLFGSTRHELIINAGWAEKYPKLVPLVPASILQSPFTDLRGIYQDLLAISKKDGGFIRANETTPYPLEQLAGMWCVPLDHLKATVAICLNENVRKLIEPSPGIFYITSTETYALSDRWKRSVGKAEASSEKTEVGTAKAAPRLKENKGEKKKEKTYPDDFHAEDVRLTELLIELMEKNNPESSIIKRLTLAGRGRWADVSRKLREIDGRTPAQIESVIRFSQDDSFWSGNILSLPTLREKWDQLVMKAKRNQGASAGSRVGAHPPASSAEKEISRKVEEFARSLWKEAEPALAAARCQGQKAFMEANEKVQREVERKIVEYRKQLIKGGQS